MKKLAKVIEHGKNIYELLNASFQYVKRLFFLAYFIVAPPDDNTPADGTASIKSNKNYFFQEEKLKTTTY